ncbi:MAG: FAD:protein FMN transferase [Actinobacteria bacterium]|nr:FAD:protein FMN transferase [Actinomycetota bacterium]
MKYVKSLASIIFIVLFSALTVVGIVYLSSRNSSVGDSEGVYSSGILFAMDTTLDITIHGLDEKAAKADVDAAVGLIKRIEALTSRFEADSDVLKINANAGRGAVVVDPIVIEMVERSAAMSGICNGAFDFTIAPVVSLWGFYNKEFRVPASGEIDSVLPLVDYRQVAADKGNNTVMLLKPGMELDLGGVAKGYAVEKVCGLLKERGVENALVNFGGAVGAIGGRIDGEPWVIGIKDPRGGAGDIIGRLELEDGYVSSSGDYERYFEKDGLRYFHIFDPGTGRQPEGVIAVTVAGPSSLEADILSTAVMVLGVEEGTRTAEESGGFELVVIDSSGTVSYSPGMKNNYSITVDSRI